MKLWIAREKGNNTLWVYTEKPYLVQSFANPSVQIWSQIKGDFMQIRKDLFPEVTFENSPQQVEIKLI